MSPVGAKEARALLDKLRIKHKEMCDKPVVQRPDGVFEPDHVRIGIEKRLQGLELIVLQYDELEAMIALKNKDLDTFINVSCNVSERNGGLNNTGKDFGSDISGPKRERKWKLEDDIRKSEYKMIRFETDQSDNKAKLKSRANGLRKSIEGRWELLAASAKMQKERVLGAMTRQDTKSNTQSHGPC